MKFIITSSYFGCLCSQVNWGRILTVWRLRVSKMTKEAKRSRKMQLCVVWGEAMVLNITGQSALCLFKPLKPTDPLAACIKSNVIHRHTGFKGLTCLYMCHHSCTTALQINNFVLYGTKTWISMGFLQVHMPPISCCTWKHRDVHG